MVIRYFVADVVQAQRWIAPALVFVAAALVSTPTSGPVLPTYAISAAVMMPVAMWFTIVVFHNEEPAQAAITMAVAGGFDRVWPAKLLTAFLVSLVVSVVAFGYVTVSTIPQQTPVLLGVGVLDYLMCAVAGVAFGALISRPVVPKIAWTVLLGVAISLGQLLIRHAPPVNAMIQLYAGDAPVASVGSLLVIALETVVLAAIVVVAARTLARQRT